MSKDRHGICEIILGDRSCTESLEPLVHFRLTNFTMMVLHMRLRRQKLTRNERLGNLRLSL